MSDVALIYPDGTAKSRGQISADLATRNTSLVFKTPVHAPPGGFDWWTQRALDAQDVRRQAVGIPEHVEVQIGSDAPVIIGCLGDVHGGAQDADYQMLHHDISVLRDHPQCYVLLFGDLTDSYFFTPAVHEHIMNLYEQYMFMKSACDELNGKILAAWPGNHELWASRMGPTMYSDWVNRYNTHYLEGVAYVTLAVNDVMYRIVGSHKHRGFSVYNDSHASRRQVLDDAENADISVTAHKHIKAHSVQYTKEHGGTARPVNYVSLGSYCPSTGYSRVQGWHSKARNQMGGTFLVLWHDQKRIEVFQTIDEATGRVAQYLQ
jgi:hypothetical protein